MGLQEILEKLKAKQSSNEQSKETAPDISDLFDNMETNSTESNSIKELENEISQSSVLEVYRNLISKWKELREESKDIDESMAKLQKDTKDLEFDQEDLDYDSNQERASLKEELEEKEKEKFNYLLEEIDNLNKDIEKLKSYSPNIDLKTFEDKIKDIYEDLNFIKPTVDYIKRYNFKLLDVEVKDTLGYFKSMVNNFRKLSFTNNISDDVKNDVLAYKAFLNKKNSEISVKAIYDKVIEIPKNMKLTTNGKLIVYGIGVLGIGLAFVKLYYLLLIPIGFGVRQMMLMNNANKYFDEMILNLSKIVSVFDDVTNIIETERQDYIKKKTYIIQKKINIEIANLTMELNKKKDNYNLKLVNIIVDDSEIDRRINERYEAKYNAIRENINKFKEMRAELADKKSACLEKNEELMQKITHCKQIITDTYWSLKIVGSSFFYPKEYLLGFQNDELISIDSDGKTLLILFTGVNSEKNNVLINMIIGQVFGFTRPAQLLISVIDTEFSGRDYAVFNTKELKNVFNFITREDEINNFMNELYSDFLARQKMIKPIADNVVDYNRKMLETESIPYGFNLVIFQNIKESLLNNSLFLQICRGGPELGIYPIIFWNSSSYDELVKSKPETVKDFLQIVEKSAWGFNQVYYDVEKKEELCKYFY